MYYSIVIQTNQDLLLPKQYPLSIIQVPIDTPMTNQTVLWEGKVISFDVLITEDPKKLEVLWDGVKIVTNRTFETSMAGVYVIGKLVDSSLSTQEQLDTILEELGSM